MGKLGICSIIIAILVGIAPFVVTGNTLVWTEVVLAIILLIHTFMEKGGCPVCKVSTVQKQAQA